MYNFRILIQEIQLVGDPLGSMFLLHMAQPARDIYRDQAAVGEAGQNTGAVAVERSSPCPVLRVSRGQGGYVTCFKK